MVRVVSTDAATVDCNETDLLKLNFCVHGGQCEPVAFPLSAGPWREGAIILNRGFSAGCVTLLGPRVSGVQAERSSQKPILQRNSTRYTDASLRETPGSTLASVTEY